METIIRPLPHTIRSSSVMATLLLCRASGPGTAGRCPRRLRASGPYLSPRCFDLRGMVQFELQTTEPSEANAGCTSDATSRAVATGYSDCQVQLP